MNCKVCTQEIKGYSIRGVCVPCIEDVSGRLGRFRARGVTADTAHIWSADLVGGVHLEEKDGDQLDPPLLRQIECFQLHPTRDGVPSIELRVNVAKGEHAIRFRQVTADALSGNQELVREVLGIRVAEHQFFVLYGSDNKLYIATTEDI